MVLFCSLICMKLFPIILQFLVANKFWGSRNINIYDDWFYYTQDSHHFTKRFPSQIKRVESKRWKYLTILSRRQLKLTKVGLLFPSRQSVSSTQDSSFKKKRLDKYWMVQKASGVFILHERLRGY